MDFVNFVLGGLSPFWIKQVVGGSAVLLWMVVAYASFLLLAKGKAFTSWSWLASYGYYLIAVLYWVTLFCALWTHDNPTDSNFYFAAAIVQGVVLVYLTTLRYSQSGDLNHDN